MGTLHDLIVREQWEPYVTRKELAGMMGVSVDRVDTLRKAGMPSVLFGQRQRRFRPSAALAWARSNGSEVV